MEGSSAPVHSLRRDPERGVLGGVCAGIAERLGVDPLIIRVAFVAAAVGGFGIPAYLIAWVALPAEAGGRPPVAIFRTGRAAVEVALGVGLLVVAALLAMRELGFWFSDAVAWPLVLIAAGGALLWRQSMGGPPETATETVKPAAVAPAPKPAPAAPQPGPKRVEVQLQRERPDAAGRSRTGIGIALVVAAGFAFLQATGALGAVRDVLLAIVAVVVVLGVILAPWIVRLVRSLSQERAERIRSQERAEVAAHLHDSVLQTLAMVQRRADDPQEVAQLARRQERELRAWLSNRPAPGRAASLAAALEEAAARVEERHGVPVEVVAVGDSPLDPAAEALVGAAREAMTNAAKFGGGSPVDVYAESSNGRVQVFIRDRGPGFDPAALPPDRRGVKESIVGRMRRHGGRATITSAPGAGTEVELVLQGRDE
jgi:signal transduction histidine kinase/phage shock protein PspC (stress-responsive transcriptional regulator)